MGPTASGKTDLALQLLQQLPFEIISIDSALIYRGMNIGTAKPDAKILASIPHHLIDICDPGDSYSAAMCCSDVQKSSDDIIARGKIPLLVGGTMMYFRALQQGLSVLPEASDETRKQLMQEAFDHGWDYMHQKLQKVDPISALRIHANDTQRVQRALEVYALTGKPLSTLIKQDKALQNTQYVNLMLMPDDRAWLHERIGVRFKQMLNDGFIDEVEHLIKQWSLTLDYPSMRCVGYRQVFEYLQGNFDYTTLQDKGVAATRQLAKRQLTWLRHWPTGESFIAENQSNARDMMVFINDVLDKNQWLNV